MGKLDCGLFADFSATSIEARVLLIHLPELISFSPPFFIGCFTFLSNYIIFILSHALATRKCIFFYMLII